MSLSFEEAFIKSGIVTEEELKKKEAARLKAIQEEKDKRKEEELCYKSYVLPNKGNTAITMTPEQIENWRRVLCKMLGPYAAIMSAEEIQVLKNKMQGEIDSAICPTCKGEDTADTDAPCPDCKGAGLKASA